MLLDLTLSALVSTLQSCYWLNATNINMSSEQCFYVSFHCFLTLTLHVVHLHNRISKLQHSVIINLFADIDIGLFVSL